MRLPVAAVTTAALMSIAACGAKGPEPKNAVVRPYVLVTQCGVNEVENQGFWFRRQGGALSDGKGHAPGTWGEPTQIGQLTIKDKKAVFIDSLGHKETFVWEPGQTERTDICG